jgi:hypothetical protein
MKLKEGFQSSSQSVDDTTRRSINAIYRADAMRNLSSIASQLTTSNYLRLPGDLVVDRSITCSGRNLKLNNILLSTTDNQEWLRVLDPTSLIDPIGTQVHTYKNLAAQNLWCGWGSLTTKEVKIEPTGHIDLGYNHANREINSGKIVYQTGDTGALQIIGKGMANNNITRKIELYDDVTINGNLIMKKNTGNKLYFGNESSTRSSIYDNTDLYITTDDNLRINASKTIMTGDISCNNLTCSSINLGSWNIKLTTDESLLFVKSDAGTSNPTNTLTGLLQNKGVFCIGINGDIWFNKTVTNAVNGNWLSTIINTKANISTTGNTGGNTGGVIYNPDQGPL